MTKEDEEKPIQKTEYIGEISFNKIDLFVNIIKLIDTLTAREPVISFNKDGIFTYLFSDAMYYELRISKDFFLTYNIEKEFNISIKRNLLSDLFKKVPSDNCEVIWRITKDADLLKITIKERKLKRYDLRLLDITKDKTQDLESLDKYKDTKVTINTEDLIDMINSVYFTENKILMKCTEYNFDVKDFDYTSGSSLIRFMKSDKLQIECKTNVEGYYNRKIMLEALEIIKNISEKIILTFSTQSPLKIYFKNNNIEFKYYIAPMEGGT